MVIPDLDANPVRSGPTRSQKLQAAQQKRKLGRLDWSRTFVFCCADFVRLWLSRDCRPAWARSCSGSTGWSRAQHCSCNRSVAQGLNAKEQEASG